MAVNFNLSLSAQLPIITITDEANDNALGTSTNDSNVNSNYLNIANGNASNQISPDEEVIKARGRKINNKINRIKYEELPMVLATRKSPRKSSNVDFTHFFRSPTPKKKTPVKSTPQLDHIRIRSSIRKRLTLNSQFDTPTSHGQKSSPNSSSKK